jgi:hypothetical protein
MARDFFSRPAFTPADTGACHHERKKWIATFLLGVTGDFLRDGETKGDTIMKGTKKQGWMALLAGAFLAFPGCVMEPDMELGNDENELAGAESLPPVDPCNATFSPAPELTIALPLVMNKSGNSSRLPVDTGWYTNALIQNTSSALATVRLRAISTTGTNYCSIFSLGSEEFVNFRPDNIGAPGTIGIPGLPAGNFEGSMLIETDQRLAVTAKLSNVPMNDMGRTGGTAAGAYMGLPTNTWSAELAYPIMKSGFNGSSTTLFVQNVEAWGDWLNLEVRTNDSKMYTYSTYVPGGQSVAIQPSQLRDGFGNPMPSGCSGGANPGMPGAPCFGSVRIVPYWEFGARFAAIAIEHPATGLAPTILANHFENVWLASHHQWLPVIKNQYQGASSGIGIMNLSSVHQDITVILREKAVPWVEYRYTFEDVPPYRSVVASASAGTFGGFPAGKIGVAEVESTGPITSVVNESTSSSVSSYHGQSVRGDLAAPLIKVAFAGRRTRATLWNVSNQAVQISGRYKCRTTTGGTYSDHTHTMTAAANTAIDFEPINIPAGNLCSAIFTTTQGTLVGVVAEEDMANSSLEGSIYEAIVLD